MKVELYRTPESLNRWDIKAANGKAIATSIESYVSRTDALHSLCLVLGVGIPPRLRGEKIHRERWVEVEYGSSGEVVHAVWYRGGEQIELVTTIQATPDTSIVPTEPVVPTVPTVPITPTTNTSATSGTKKK